MARGEQENREASSATRGRSEQRERRERKRERWEDGELRQFAAADEPERWHQVESYVAARTEVTFSHGIWPDCFEGQMAAARQLIR